MKKYEVVIVGAGTAGLMLARELGKQQCKTLLLDRKKNLLDISFNTLGSFIKIANFGLTENVVAQKINSIIIQAKNLQEHIYVDAVILDKKKVHEELIASLDKNFVDIQLDVHINQIHQNSEKTFTAVSDKNGNSYQATIFVDCSGTAGILSKKVGLQIKNPVLAVGVEYNVKYFGKSDEAYLLLGKEYKGGYGWIFPLKNQRAIIGFGTFDETMVKGLKERLNEVLQLPNIKKLVEKDNEIVEGGSIPITPVLDKFVIENLVCVGDSVSQVNPIVGEGYKFIFESAIMASEFIVKSIKNNSIIHLSDYEQTWRKRFLSNYKRSKIAQKRIFSLTKSDFFVKLGIFLLKLRPNKKNASTLSGEYF